MKHIIKCIWITLSRKLAMRRVRSASAGLLLVCLLALQTGCTREYKVPLSNESVNVGDKVTLDGVEVGKVVEIKDDANGNQTAIIGVNPRSIIRAGTVREARNAINLSSSGADPAAPALADGSIIKTRTAISNTSRRALDKVQDVLWTAGGYARDHPAIVSVFGILAVALALIIVLRVFRKAIFLFLVGIFISASLLAGPTQTGIQYTREYLTERQRTSQQTVSEVEQALTSAARLLDARLAGAAEQIVRSLFLIDVVSIRLEGEPDKIQALKSHFGTIKAEEQRKLNAAYAQLRERVQLAQLDAAKVAERCNSEKALSVLSIFQSKQAEYRGLIRAGMTDVNVVLTECNRQLAESLKPTIVHEVAKDNGQFERLRKEHSELQQKFEALRREQEESAKLDTKRPNVVVVTNEVRVEKLIPAPAHPPTVITNVVTNEVTKVIQKLITVPASIAPNPASASTNRIQPGVVRSKTVAAKTAGSTAAITHRSMLANSKLAVGIVGGVAAACALLWLTFLSSVRGRPFILSLNCNSRGAESIDIAAVDDAVCLQTPLICQNARQLNGSPHIVVTWRGPLLRPGKHSAVRVNERSVSRQQKLFPGDSIMIEGENPQEFNFLGCDPASADVTAEVPPSTQH